MNPTLIAAGLSAVLLAGSIVTIVEKDSKIKEHITKGKELQTAQKLSTIGDKEKIKLSNLIQNVDLSNRKKRLLNNFQKAVNVAVIKENIDNPTCNDLSKTGYITLKQCQEIKDEKNDYAEVNNDNIALTNKKLAKIVSAEEPFKEVSEDNETGEVMIKPINKISLDKKRKRIRRFIHMEKKERKILASIKDTNEIKEYAKAIKEKITDPNNNNVYAKKRLLGLMARLAVKEEKLKMRKNSNNVDKIENKNIEEKVISKMPEIAKNIILPIDDEPNKKINKHDDDKNRILPIDIEPYKRKQKENKEIRQAANNLFNMFQ